MSYIKKKLNQTLNDDLQLEDYDEKNVFVRLLNTDTRDFWDENLLDVNAIWKKKGWIVGRNNLDKLKVIALMTDEAVEEIDEKTPPKKRRKQMSDESEEEEYSDEESSSTDDELIQKALARRLMSESTQKEIDMDYVDDSEMEDVVSVCRRFRFLYREIRTLRQRIAELEKRI